MSIETQGSVDEGLRRAFEVAWRTGQPLGVEHFLPRRGEPTYLPTLEELIQIDLEFAWKAGAQNDATTDPARAGPRVEEYVARFLELKQPGILLRLLEAEFLVRHRWADAPSVGEYGRRFPELGEQLSAALAAAAAEIRPSNGKGTEDGRKTLRSAEEAARMETTPQAPEEIETVRGVLDDTATMAAEILTAESKFGGLRFHAQGGLGEIYTAQDEDLHRLVVLKFIRPDHAEDTECQRRFMVEAEVTARLSHPGVVPVYCLGHVAGRPFYAMEYVQGESLNEAIERYHRLPVPTSRKDATKHLMLRELLTRFVAVCNTIAYAHNRGVLHRDLKPENILLGKYAETIVVDWGLALPVGRDESARGSGEPTLRLSTDSSNDRLGVAGTPAYLSPEQAEGRLDVTPASDIYSLGATLYKLLTGQRPFTGRTLSEVLSCVRTGQFPALRALRPEVPRPLEAICLKAMALKPSSRYASARELAADIERWLADEPVSVDPEPWSDRLARWGRKHRHGALSAAVIGLAMIVLGIGTTVWQREVAQSERSARAAAEQAHREADESRLQGQQIAARFAAETVAREMDLRWQILEFEAVDARLQQLLRRADADAADKPWQELAAWLDQRYIRHQGATRAASWALVDRDGLQLARSPVPVRESTVGENYQFRDYFHGRGRDLPRDQIAGVEPIRRVHRSTVFRSDASGKLMVAFSVPVWDVSESPENAEPAPIGVLLMTVELGQFRVLQAGLGPGHVAVLVATEMDWIEGRPRNGLILHHPALLEFQRESLTIRAAAPRVNADWMAWMKGLQTPDQTASTPSTVHFRRGYRDPLAAAEDRWRVACQPIRIAGRPLEVQDTGWVVLVQERELSPLPNGIADQPTPAVRGGVPSDQLP